ncbi:MAG: alpha-ketoglutarate-dependent dioxygenase AlkB [Gammaproteobacteria bacterium]|nr:alpha-ketoglutarate-dependent dioxygenase AlkB [Gammaproteobacteria bacterium]
MSASAVQACLFEFGPQLLIDDAEGGVFYRPGVFEPAVAALWFTALRDAVDWQSMRRPMYDRVVDVPRLVSAYRLESPDLPEPLLEIADCVRAELGQPFNTVGCNYYRDGNDSVAPHNDKLDTLVPGHPIALLSLGATRRMTIRAKAPPRAAIHVDLEPGSLLVMSHTSQLHYDHGIPKSRGQVPPRMSLAFRVRPTGPRSRSIGRTLQPARPAY